MLACLVVWESCLPLVCPVSVSDVMARGVIVGGVGIGAGYATAKTGVSAVNVCVMRPELLTRAVLPVVMAGIVGLYGVIVGIAMIVKLNPEKFTLFLGAMQLSGGLACGLCSLASGFAIGVVGEAGIRGFAQQQRLLTGMILILIFAEVLGLYGMILALMIVN